MLKKVKLLELIYSYSLRYILKLKILLLPQQRIFIRPKIELWSIGLCHLVSLRSYLLTPCFLKHLLCVC